MASDLTQLLKEVSAGTQNAVERLAEAVQLRLRGMAEKRLAREFGPGQPGLTIQPTILADDTFMRLIKQRNKFDSGGHFFAIAAQEMRRVLIDYHRRRKAAMRGHGLRVTWNPECEPVTDESTVDLERLDLVLTKLAQLDHRKADVVQSRVFFGLSIEETAAALGVGHATVERDWRFSKVWLAKELSVDK